MIEVMRAVMPCMVDVPLALGQTVKSIIIIMIIMLNNNESGQLQIFRLTVATAW
jgi:hypothetical protein